MTPENKIPEQGAVTLVLAADAGRPLLFVDGLPNRFPTFRYGDVVVDVWKYPDATLEIIVAGPHGRSWRFRAPLPPVVAPTGLQVMVTWTLTYVSLYIDCQKVQALNVARAAPDP